MRKLIKKYTKEANFLEAPWQIKTTDAGELRTDEQNNEANELGWWFSRDDGYYKSTHASNVCRGLTESLEKVQNELLEAEKQGEPYDGVIAFSQGACLLSIICHLREYESQNYPFRFCMFFSGFKSAGLDHAKFYEKKITTIPTFHSVGKDDQVVTSDRGVALAELYEGSILMEHDGGHFMPSKGTYRPQYHAFLDKFTAE